MIPTLVPSAPSTTEIAAAAPRTRTSRLALVSGLVLQSVAAVVLAASGLMMPLWAVVALWAVWVVGLAVQIRARDRPLVVIAVPVVSGAIWLLTGTLGEAHLGWTA